MPKHQFLAPRIEFSAMTGGQIIPPHPVADHAQEHRMSDFALLRRPAAPERHISGYSDGPLSAYGPADSSGEGGVQRKGRISLEDLSKAQEAGARIRRAVCVEHPGKTLKKRVFLLYLRFVGSREWLLVANRRYYKGVDDFYPGVRDWRSADNVATALRKHFDGCLVLCRHDHPCLPRLGIHPPE